MFRFKLLAAVGFSVVSFAGVGHPVGGTPGAPAPVPPSGGSTFQVYVNGTIHLSTPDRSVAVSFLDYELSHEPFGSSISIVHTCPSCR